MFLTELQTVRCPETIPGNQLIAVYRKFNPFSTLNPKYRLTEDLVWKCPFTSIIITIPAGFVTDYASVPRGLHWLIPPDGPYAKAAVLHDYLYATGIYSRSISDGIFKQAMSETSIPLTYQYILFNGAILCGKASWDKWRQLQSSDVDTWRVRSGIACEYSMPA